MSLESRQLLNLSRIYREKINVDESIGTLTNADKKANTPAWQNRNKLDTKGKPLYKMAPHLNIKASYVPNGKVIEDKDWGYDKKGNSLNPKDKKKKLKTKDTVDEAIGTAIATGAALGIAAGGAALIPKVKKFGQNLKNKAQQRTQMKTEEKKAVKDFDGDGKLESPEDEYKGSKDKAIKKAIRKESFSNWREDLKEVPNYEQLPIDAKDRNKKIEEKNVKNKVKINPEMKEELEIIEAYADELNEADIADIIARLEKKRISKGGNPDESPLPSMRKYHADKKKKKETTKKDS